MDTHRDEERYGYSQRETQLETETQRETHTKKTLRYTKREIEKERE